MITPGDVAEFVVYSIRWQLSGLIIAPCVALFKKMNPWKAVAIGNLIGAIAFYVPDRGIFNIVAKWAERLMQ